MKRWKTLSVVAVLALACNDSPASVDPAGELGDIVIGERTISYDVVVMAARIVDRPVEEIWHGWHATILASYEASAPEEADPSPDPDRRRRLLEWAGVEAPEDVLEAFVNAADVAGR